MTGLSTQFSMHVGGLEPTQTISGLRRLGMTAAAEELLELHVNDARARVLREAQRIHAPVSYDSRIDAAEVQAALSRIQAADRSSPQLSLKMLPDLARTSSGPMYVFLLGMILTAVSAIAALSLTVATLVADPHDSKVSDSLTNLVIGILAGIVAMLVSCLVCEVLRYYRSRLRRESSAASREFVRQLAVIEGRATRIAAQLSETGRTVLPLRAALNALEHAGVWRPEDVEIFRRLLSLRNSVVHEESLTLGEYDLAYALAESARLEDLLPSWRDSRTDEPAVEGPPAETRTGGQVLKQVAQPTR